VRVCMPLMRDSMRCGTQRRHYVRFVTFYMQRCRSGKIAPNEPTRGADRARYARGVEGARRKMQRRCLPSFGQRRARSAARAGVLPQTGMRAKRACLYVQSLRAKARVDKRRRASRAQAARGSEAESAACKRYRGRREDAACGDDLYRESACAYREENVMLARVRKPQRE